jgi:hypothetical protein
LFPFSCAYGDVCCGNALMISPNEANHDAHIDAHRLIRHDRERSWRRADMLGHTILDIQNIIPRRQRYSIISTLIDCHPRNFFLILLTQDDQWIFSIGFRCDRRPRHVIGRFNRPGRNNFEKSLHGARRQSITRCSATGQHQKDAPNTQPLKEQILPHQISGRDRFYYPAQHKLTLWQGQTVGTAAVCRGEEHPVGGVDRQPVDCHRR